MSISSAHKISMAHRVLDAPESTTNSRPSGLYEAIGVDLLLTSPRT